jgi:phytoene dehydrogenase-like protein
MGTKNFYDAICLGHGLAPLLASSLLAKRGFRVLLLGQGQPPPTYDALGIRLPRAPFTLTHVGSPALQRVFAELALRPLLTRRSHGLSPAFQLVMPGHRLDVGAQAELLDAEVEREFPAVRRPAEDFVRSTERAWGQLNLLVEQDLMWPPTTFFEKRAMTRAALHHPFGKDDGVRPLAELADDHPMISAFAARLRFMDGSELGATNTQRELRQIAGSLRAASVDTGYAGLWELLVESIRAHNGDVRLLDRADNIEVRRGGLGAVRLTPSDEEVGCHFLLSGLSMARLARHLSDRRLLDDMADELGAPRPRYYRYTLNLVVPNDAVPEGMARTVLLVGDARKVDGEHRLWVELTPIHDEARSVLTVEALVPALPPDDESAYLSDMRERVLGALDLLSPFLRHRVLAIDSPHDGRPLRDVVRGCDVACSDPWPRGPGTMAPVYAHTRMGLHGCTALPVRTPVKHLLLCNDQVVPGLGLEGSFLCAWSAARAVTRSLGRQWMNRHRWTKVEL